MNSRAKITGDDGGEKTAKRSRVEVLDGMVGIINYVNIFVLHRTHTCLSNVCFLRLPH